MNIENLLSDKVKIIQPSGIRKFFDIVTEMKDAISLGVGEPDFVTPWHIREAGIFSLERGSTHYTSNSGIVELRQEIAGYLKRKFQLEYDYSSQILVTVGGSEAIDICIRSLVNPGEEVLIPEPSSVYSRIADRRFSATSRSIRSLRYIRKAYAVRLERPTRPRS